MREHMVVMMADRYGFTWFVLHSKEELDRWMKEHDNCKHWDYEPCQYGPRDC